MKYYNIEKGCCYSCKHSLVSKINKHPSIYCNLYGVRGSSGKRRITCVDYTVDNYNFHNSYISKYDNTFILKK